MTQAEPLTADSEVQQLAPRILADVFADGELRAETLQRHLKNNTRVPFLWGSSSVLLLLHIGLLFHEGESTLRIVGQVGILGGLVMMAQHIRGQRPLLKRLIQAATE